MRYAEVRLLPDSGGFHPADRKLVDSDTIQRVAIHHVNQLDDGTVVLLYELQGETSEIRRVLERDDDILTHSLSRERDPDIARGQSTARGRAVHAYIHIDPNDTLIAVFQLPQEHSLVLDTPIECLPDGGIRLFVLGDQPTLTNALRALPEGIDAELLATGEYHPTDRTLYSRLTPRQRDVLTAAVEAGYYEVPREVTHAGLAEQLELAPVTVGEHLRKIEARVFSKIVPSVADERTY